MSIRLRLETSAPDGTPVPVATCDIVRTDVGGDDAEVGEYVYVLLSANYERQLGSGRIAGFSRKDAATPWLLISLVAEDIGKQGL